MSSEHYFSATPGSEPGLRKFHARLVGQVYELTTGNGIFSPERVDAGTEVLLSHVPAPPPGGDLLDLGSGWGPIVWAVDVNERALDLVRTNAAALGLTNVNAARPDDVPADVSFTTIWSNPPIRVGKNELHGLLERWLPRLQPGSDAWLVVQRNLGSDSLHRWLQATFPEEFAFSRAATNKGYRVLRGRRHG
jgi:16S rRNA (guanine1207-N2)-methyltransferase